MTAMGGVSMKERVAIYVSFWMQIKKSRIRSSGEETEAGKVQARLDKAALGQVLVTQQDGKSRKI
jgi:hypothetical protein